MIEKQYKTSKVPSEQLLNLTNLLLSIPKQHKLLHPCQDRTKYSNILQWLITSLSAIKQTTGQIFDQQQKLIVSAFSEVIELTRKECMEKGCILEMILEYFMGILEGYWKQYEHRKQQISYEFSHNILRIQKDYLQELKRLTKENEQLKKDRDHKWKNMFMLIKDNRIHRKQNKKLIKQLHQEIQKSKMATEQLINAQLQNQKFKIKIQQMQGQIPQFQEFMETSLRLNQLEKRIKDYPKKTRKMIKSSLTKIQIDQSHNLKQKIQFIINAIEQTGQIIQDTYDDDHPLAHLQFNISVQTENPTDQKGTNTIAVKTVEIATQSKTHEHVNFEAIDTVEVKIIPRKQRKQTTFRESKNVMFASTNNMARSGFIARSNDARARSTFRKLQNKGMSICQSLRITITQCRISYISSYNTEIFNGTEIVREIEKKVQCERVKQRKKVHKKLQEVYVQTQQQLLIPNPSYCYSRPTVKSFRKMPTLQDQWQKNINYNLQFSQQIQFCFNPTKVSKKSPQKPIRSSMIKKISRDKLMERRNTQQQERQNKQVRFSLAKIMQKQSSKQLLDEYHNKYSNDLESIRKQTNDTKHTKIQTQTANQSDAVKQQLSQINKTPLYNSAQVSGVMTPIQNTDKRSKVTSSRFSNTLTNLNQHLHKNSSKRNVSSIVSQTSIAGQSINKLQTTKLFKTKVQQSKPKRFATENNQPKSLLSLESDNFLKPNEPSITKMKPLHRISQDFSQNDRNLQPRNQNKQKINPSKLLFSPVRDTEINIKDVDFGKMSEKILKNIEVRFHEIISKSHNFKTYLTSFFKCFYGKQLYPNFYHYVSRNNNNIDELLITFSQLLNPKLPQKYSSDLFKTFGSTVSKCYQIGQCPMTKRCRLDILKYMIGQYYEEDEAVLFQMKMRKKLCFSLLGWFNCLEMEIRKTVINSQLYIFLNQILPQTQDSISYEWIEQLSFFASSEPLAHKYLIKSRCFLNNNTPIHRVCLFFLRIKWNSLLSIDTTVSKEYIKRIGRFNLEKSIRKIENSMDLVRKFDNLDKCIRHWLRLHDKYGFEVNKTLLMLVQLNIQETILRDNMPLSRDLKFINLAFEGLRKKRYYEEIRQKS